MTIPKLEVVKRLPLLPRTAKKMLKATKVDLSIEEGKMVLKVNLPLKNRGQAERVLTREGYSYEKEGDCLIVQSQRRSLVKMGRGFTVSLDKAIGRLVIGDYVVDRKTVLGYLVLIREGDEIELDRKEMLSLHEMLVD